MQLGQIMTPRVVTIAPDESAAAAWTRMRRRGIRHLAVMDDGRLVGLVTATDVFDALRAERAPRMNQAERQLLRAPASSKRLGGNPLSRRHREAPGRQRQRSPANETKREPVPAQLPRATKRAVGRTEAPLVPANIRAMGVDIDGDTRAYIRRRLGMKLGKFALSIERVTVRLRDVNGPRGGVDHQCQVKVVLSGLPSVVAEVQDASLQAAVDAAMTAAARSVRKSLQRRRTNALTRAPRAQPASVR